MGGPAVDYIVLPVFWILVTVQTGGGENRVAKVRSPGPVPCQPVSSVSFIERGSRCVLLSPFFSPTDLRIETRPGKREEERVSTDFSIFPPRTDLMQRERERGGGEDSLLVCIERERAKAVGPSIKRYLAARGRVLCLVPPPRGVATRGGRKSGGKKKGTFVRLFCPCKVASIPLPNLQTVT